MMCLDVATVTPRHLPAESTASKRAKKQQAERCSRSSRLRRRRELTLRVMAAGAGPGE